MTTKTEQPPPQSFWKVAEVAAFLRMSPQWVYKHAELGTLPCSRFGSGLRFDPAKIRAYAEEQSSGGKTTTAQVLPFQR